MRQTDVLHFEEVVTLTRRRKARPILFAPTNVELRRNDRDDGHKSSRARHPAATEMIDAVPYDSIIHLPRQEVNGFILDRRIRRLIPKAGGDALAIFASFLIALRSHLRSFRLPSIRKSFRTLKIASQARCVLGTLNRKSVLSLHLLNVGR